MNNKTICLIFLTAAFIASFVLSATGYGAVFCVKNPVEFQDALNKAASNSEDDTIYVAEGTYNVTTTLTYNAVAGEIYTLSIIGAGAGCVGTGLPILDGGSSVQILNINTTGLVSDALAHISVSGINFKNGENSGDNGGGLAVLTKYANIAVQNSEFVSNGACNGGGAYTSSSYGAITLTNNTFISNATSTSSSTWGPSNGGGAYASSSYGAVTLTNNKFISNATSTSTTYSTEGGGAYASSSYGTVTLTNNKFISNSLFCSYAYSRGGGAYASSSNGTVTLTNNIFSGNVTSGNSSYGGGAYASSSNGTVTLTNNIFSDRNVTSGNSGYGGGAYASSSNGTVTLTNNTFIDNVSNSYGGGAYILLYNDPAKVNVYNNILWDNTAYKGGNDGDDLYVFSDQNGNGIGSPVNLFNNDLGLNADFITAMSEDLVVTDTDFYSQDSNIQSNCLLKADFHLQAGSPCIDTGNNNAPSLPSTDFEGCPRIINNVVDIGADEFWPILGNMNNGCSVDISDVILVLRCALDLPVDPYQCMPCGDINGDSKVDISDVILTLRMALGLDTLKQCTE